MLTKADTMLILGIMSTKTAIVTTKVVLPRTTSMTILSTMKGNRSSPLRKSTTIIQYAALLRRLRQIGRAACKHLSQHASVWM